MINDVEWDYWCRAKVGQPRQFGLKRDKLVDANNIKEEWGIGHDLYAGIFSEWQKEQEQFDTMYIDIDWHKGGLDANKTFGLLTLIPEPTRLYFTGRGLALYYDFNKFIRGSWEYSDYVHNLIDEWKVEKYIDTSVLGDVSRMARIPNSYNTRGQAYMVRIAPFMDFARVFDLAQRNQNVDWVGAKLSIGEIVSKEHKKLSSVSKGKVFSEESYPPCIRKAIKLIMETGELNHIQRIHMASFLINNGERDKAKEIISHAGDYNEHITDYQLNYLEKKGFECYKCVNVPEDICPFTNKEECVYYPSINHFWKRIE